MDGMNKVTLVGALGNDPELKYTQAGQAVLKLRLATSESYVDRQGDKQQRTEWHNCVVWAKRAEGLNKILAKGSKLWVEGKLQTRSWDDKNGGGKRYATEVVAQNVGLLGSPEGNRPRAASNDDDPFGDEIPY